MSNTTTMSSSRSALVIEARKAINAFVSVNSNPKSLNEEVSAARSVMDKALSTLNNDMLSEVYNRCLSSNTPVSTFALTNKYTRWTARVDKDGQVVTRSERLDLNAFFTYAKEQGKPIIESEALISLLDVLTDHLNILVDARLSKDEHNLYINKAKCALHKLLQAINVAGVKARPIDIEYLTMALTRAKSMGVIDNINNASTTRFLMDVFHVQLTGGMYKRPEKKTNK